MSQYSKLYHPSYRLTFCIFESCQKWAWHSWKGCCWYGERDGKKSGQDRTGIIKVEARTPWMMSTLFCRNENFLLFKKRKTLVFSLRPSYSRSLLVASKFSQWSGRIFRSASRTQTRLSGVVITRVRVCNRDLLIDVNVSNRDQCEGKSLSDTPNLDSHKFSSRLRPCMNAYLTVGITIMVCQTKRSEYEPIADRSFLPRFA